MSADGSVTLTWGGGEHRFRLALGQMRELQETVNKWRVGIGVPAIGPGGLLQALATTDAWLSDVHEIVRLGLIGGGMKPFDALAMVKRYVDDRPLIESTIIARAILLAAIVGVEDDPVGKDKPETANAQATAESPSPESTASPLL